MTLIEPGSFSTGFGATARFADPNPAHDPLHQFVGSRPLATATVDHESHMEVWRAGQDRAVRTGGGF